MVDDPGKSSGIPYNQQSSSTSSSTQNASLLRQQQLHHRHAPTVQRNYNNQYGNYYINLSSRSRNLNDQRPRIPKFEPIAEDQTEDYHAYETRYKEINSYYRKNSRKWKFLFYILSVFSLLTLVMVVVELRSIYTKKKSETQQQTSLNRFTLYSFLGVWMVTGFFIYCGFLKKADSVNIQCERLQQSLSHFAMTCNKNGQISLKTLQKKVSAQYPNQIFAGNGNQQQHQQQIYQQAYQNQQRALQTLVAGGQGTPRTGNYRR